MLFLILFQARPTGRWRPPSSSFNHFGATADPPLAPAYRSNLRWHTGSGGLQTAVVPSADSPGVVRGVLSRA